ncbi:hypothetical protein SAMN04489712_114128 [Thermomonospora echinospora]|uniref:Uncharacterized protein n=1 Tax=Thermomonospora echinospora TaxID=1992 RepID=A0A1H6DA78_9ACTN|nr:hypothetical protein [Thermomonospora echinospora]SEG81723.1 hypothetical protein SAMN04489712_114128 [Thermomonospora echinospora]
MDDILLALAAAAGTSVVEAAGTSSWQAFQQALVRWFGRGNAVAEQHTRARLERTAAALTSGADDVAEARIGERAAWRALVEATLEGMEPQERQTAVAELRQLLNLHAHGGGASAGPEGIAVGGDIKVNAHDQAVAAVKIGTVSTGNPQPPDANRA